MAELPLPSLEIENFRAFKHLRIEKLGRVNLIVGGNSVGKTCLLEAVWLYANKPSPFSLLELLKLRNEKLTVTQAQDSEITEIITTLQPLFYARQIEVGTTTVSIGSPYNKYNFKLNYYTLTKDAGGVAQSIDIVSGDALATAGDIRLGLSVTSTNEGKNGHTYSLDGLLTSSLMKLDKHGIPCSLVPSDDLDIEAASRYWNAIALTEQENTVLDALRLIIPDIQRIHLAIFEKQGLQRLFMVKLSQPSPIPMSSLGDGVCRALHISLALVNSKNGILLIDEFENGLYHGVQTDLWRLIFRIAHELNIQVFATTHNWDCVEAFQQAAQEDQNEEAMLVRLQRKGDMIEPILYDERRLAIATKEMIEVR